MTIWPSVTASHTGVMRRVTPKLYIWQNVYPQSWAGGQISEYETETCDVSYHFSFREKKKKWNPERREVKISAKNRKDDDDCLLGFLMTSPQASLWQ